MTDLRNDIRELFRQREVDVRPPPELPVEILRRTKRRRVRTAALATVTAIAVAFGAVAGAGALLTHRDDIPGAGRTPAGGSDSRSVSPSPAGDTAGQDVTIASGNVHPDAHWALTVTSNASGPSLDFGYAGSSTIGVGITRLDGKVVGPVGASSSSPGNTADDPPRAVWGLVSPDVHDVTFVLSDGTTFPGQLPFPIPSSIIGPAQAFVVFLPGDVDPRGRLIAFDAAGNVLATFDMTS